MTKGSPKKARRSVGVSMIDIGNLRVDPTIQQRASLDTESVETYAAAFRAGTELPAVVAFDDPDPGQGCWLADGFHREAAAREAGISELLCDLRRGSRRDALLFAVGANHTHGLRRSGADKRRAVTTLLLDAEWGQAKVEWIAEHANVHPSFVWKVKAELRGDSVLSERDSVPEQPSLSEADPVIGNGDLEGWPTREPPAGPWTAEPLERALDERIDEAMKPKPFVAPPTEAEIELTARQISAWTLDEGVERATRQWVRDRIDPDTSDELFDRALIRGVSAGWWKLDGDYVVVADADPADPILDIDLTSPSWAAQVEAESAGLPKVEIPFVDEAAAALDAAVVAGDAELDPDEDLKPAPVSQAPDYDGDEWSTPDHIIDAARQVLGEIDLDPASNAFAQRRIRAATFYTKADDGLAQDWAGRVWLNPPYSQPLVGLFTQRIIDEHEAGNVLAAVVLVNNATETGWCQALLDGFPACFFRGRIPFLLEGKAGKAGPRQGQVAFYLGPNAQLFARVFGELGTVVMPAPATVVRP